MSLDLWARETCSALGRRAGGSLAWLFTPSEMVSLPGLSPAGDSERRRLISHEELRLATPSQILTAVHRNCASLSAELKESFCTYLRILQFCVNGEWGEVVKLCLELLDLWIGLIRAGSLPSYAVPALGSVCDFTVTAGELADENAQADMMDAEDSYVGSGAEGVDAGAAPNYSLQEVLNGIRKHIGKFRGDDANQGAYMILLSESIRVCLKLRNVQMAAAFLKTIPTNQPISPHAPKGPATRYRYYYGNLLLQRENVLQAEEPLMWSYTCCPVKQRSLKRSILACLVAARLRLGFVPPQELLLEYDLLHYGELVEAVKLGNLKLYNSAMTKHAEQFYEDGTTLCLQKVKFLVERMLCERAYAWALKNFYENDEQRNLVPLGLITAAFKWQVDFCEANAKDPILLDDEEASSPHHSTFDLGLKADDLHYRQFD